MSNEPGKPDFSNVQSGGSTVSSPAPNKPDFSNVESGGSTVSASAQSYTVVSGDSLSKIAKKFYGNANAWKQIFEANRDKISNPDMIHPGQVLTIPASTNSK
ncbi:MAG: LysM peptidoglycan-binding domain-containing protein [Gammaproteobacteria bacterium]|nr:MAG: LysM peptidoglycan-binding domain-containing protein [Gammaproteobacteria bacterium]